MALRGNTTLSLVPLWHIRTIDGVDGSFPVNDVPGDGFPRN